MDDCRSLVDSDSQKFFLSVELMQTELETALQPANQEVIEDFPEIEEKVNFAKPKKEVLQEPLQDSQVAANNTGKNNPTSTPKPETLVVHTDEPSSGKKQKKRLSLFKRFSLTKG